MNSWNNSFRLGNGIKEEHLLLFLFFTGLTFRVFCFLQNASNPLSSQVFLDETYYVNFGRAVASGYLLGESGVFFMDPLYGYFLGFFFLLFGDDLAFLKIFQIIIDAGNVLLIYFLGKKVAGRNAGVTAAFLYAVYPVAVFYALLLLKTTLTLTSLLLFTLFLIKVAEGRKPFQWFLLGCFAGLMIYLRANLLLMAPFALLAYWFVERPDAKRFIQHGVLFVAGIIFLLLPGAVRNYAVTGEMLWLNSQSGRSLYVCNNPENLSGLYDVASFSRADPIGMEEDFQREAERKLGRALSAKEASTYWRNETISFLLNNPEDFAKLMTNKLKYIVGNGEIPVNHSYSLAAKFSPIFQFHFPNFAFVLAFGGVGLFLLLRENRKAVWLLPPILCMLATMLIFYASSRFRLPMVPFLLVGSGVFLVALLEFPSTRRIVLASGVLLGCLIFWGSTQVSVPSYDDNDSYLLSKAYLKAGKPELARKTALEALEEFPAQERFLVQLGIAFLQADKYDEALHILKKAGEANPLRLDVWNNIGLVLLRVGKPEEAISSLEKAFQLSPRSETLLLLGQAWEASGNFENAQQSYQKVLKREKPGSLLAARAKEYLRSH